MRISYSCAPEGSSNPRQCEGTDIPHDLEAIAAGIDVVPQLDFASVPEAVAVGTVVGTESALAAAEAVLDLLRDIRDRLHTDPGVHAVLAIEVNIPLDGMDPATQRVACALARNAVVDVVPRVGDKLGVGIEVGAALESIG